MIIEPTSATYGKLYNQSCYRMVFEFEFLNLSGTSALPGGGGGLDHDFRLIVGPFDRPHRGLIRAIRLWINPSNRSPIDAYIRTSAGLGVTTGGKYQVLELEEIENGWCSVSHEGMRAVYNTMSNSNLFLSIRNRSTLGSITDVGIVLVVDMDQWNVDPRWPYRE